VTTPPPSRKLSTGNPLNVLNLNNPQIQAAAAKAAAALNASNTTNVNNSLASPSNPNNIQRSSSHESHLRSRTQVAPLTPTAQQYPQQMATNQQNQHYLTTNNSSKVKQSNNDLSNYNGAMNGELKDSTTNLNGKNSFENISKYANNNFCGPNNSYEGAGSEFSSRSPSGKFEIKKS
jgi:hypothetical protein